MSHPFVLHHHVMLKAPVMCRVRASVAPRMAVCINACLIAHAAASMVWAAACQACCVQMAPPADPPLAGVLEQHTRGSAAWHRHWHSSCFSTTAQRYFQLRLDLPAAELLLWPVARGNCADLDRRAGLLSGLVVLACRWLSTGCALQVFSDTWWHCSDS